MPTPIEQLFSRTSYATDGSNLVWEFSFAGGYLDKAHVKAQVYDASGAATNITVTDAMFVGPFQLLIEPAITAGKTLLIYRDTPKDLPLVDFTEESGFSEIALDTNAKQAIFVAAESVDLLNSTGFGDAATSAATAQAAAQAAISAAAIAQSYATAVGHTTITRYNGTGGQVIFTLPVTPADSVNVQVTINGIVQHADTYTVVGTTLTFSTAPALGTGNIEVRIGQLLDEEAFTGPPGPTGPAGPTGADGRGIVSVVRTAGTGAPGTTDTYTVTYSDATTSTFNVYNGANGAGTGTVTNTVVNAVGTSGTDISFSVSNPTTTPTFTLNVPTANAANRGALSAADWSTFNSKISSVTWATPGTIGSTTPNTGKFTTLEATSKLTATRVEPRVGVIASSATPSINTDLYDTYRINALAVNITSVSVTGTPIHSDCLVVEITGTATRTIAWGASFEASTVALPTTTVGTAMLTVAFMFNNATSKWRCVGVA